MIILKEEKNLDMSVLPKTTIELKSILYDILGNMQEYSSTGFTMDSEKTFVFSEAKMLFHIINNETLLIQII